MTKLNRTNSKVHYKMYKAGKHWLYASLLTVGLMAGGAFGASSVEADANDNQAPATTTTAATTQPSTDTQAAAQTSSADNSTATTDNSQTPAQSQNTGATTTSDASQTSGATTTTPDASQTSGTTTLQQRQPTIRELIKHRPRILQQQGRTTRPKRLGLIKTIINPQRLRLMIRLQLALTMMPPRLTHRIRQATNLIKMRLTTRTKPLTQPQPMIRTRPLLKTLMQPLIPQRQPLPRIQPIHRQQPIKPLR